MKNKLCLKCLYFFEKITQNVEVVQNNVNIKKASTYDAAYSVEDTAGNKTEKTIKITVEKSSCIKNVLDKVIDGIYGFFDWLF